MRWHEYQLFLIHDQALKSSICFDWFDSEPTKHNYVQRRCGASSSVDVEEPCFATLIMLVMDAFQWKHS